MAAAFFFAGAFFAGFSAAAFFFGAALIPKVFSTAAFCLLTAFLAAARCLFTAFLTAVFSLATAFLAAACGLKIAKHGNRSVSSKCGSADVLERLGYQLDRSAEQIAESIDGLGIGFLFAPNFHQAVRFAMPVRKTLASRTIFNLLGPLINPANPDYQLIGIYDPALIRPIAETLRLLGCKSALVVHGSGLDEIAIHGPTIACRLMDSEISEIRIDPSDFFRQRFSISDLTGGDPAENADSLKRCLTGSASDAYHFAVALNTAALLVLAEQVDTFSDGFELALDRLLSGAAAEKLAQFIKRTEDVSTDH